MSSSTGEPGSGDGVNIVLGAAVVLLVVAIGVTAMLTVRRQVQMEAMHR